MSFVHLHVHSEYSWLDGACFIDDLVRCAKKRKLPAVAITDRNSINGAYRLSQKCHEAGIKPIIGLEIEVLNDITDGRAFSVILLAKNITGFYNLSRLVNLAHEYDKSAPKISKSMLQEHAKGLICLSFSVVGELCTLLLEDRKAVAIEVSEWYQGVFGEDYYYEIQDHGLPKEAIAMNQLLNLAHSSKVPVVLTNDCHYMQRKDSIAIDALNCIRRGIDFRHPEAKRFACNEYYYKAPAEMKNLSVGNQELVKNTLKIADSIELDLLSEIPPQKDLVDFNAKLWNPKSIYAEILKVLNVPPAEITELCDLIPHPSSDLGTQKWKATDFSAFTTKNSLHDQGLWIAEILQRTFRDKAEVGG